jgi:hypothetical protein
VPGEVTQATESFVGPYALQDFNLYYLTRYGMSPSKIAFLAWTAWHDAAGRLAGRLPDNAQRAYDLAEIKRWLELFLKRFFANQFKRSAMPNGPKISSGGALSPRGDWRMPSDATADAWLAELARAGVRTEGALSLKSFRFSCASRYPPVQAGELSQSGVTLGRDLSGYPVRRLGHAPVAGLAQRPAQAVPEAGRRPLQPSRRPCCGSAICRGRRDRRRHRRGHGRLRRRTDRRDRAWVTILVEPEARDSAPGRGRRRRLCRRPGPRRCRADAGRRPPYRQPEVFGEAAVTAAKAAEQGLIVTFGVKPTVPATGFGYIRPGAPLLDGSVREVAAFVEKPDRETAERYVLEGYLWNSGNFAFKASTLLAEFEAFEPTVAAAAKACAALLQLEAGVGYLDREAFSGAAKISLDYAVMERTTKAAVVPGRLRLVGPGRLGRDLGSLGPRRCRQRQRWRCRPARRLERPGSLDRPVCRRDRGQRHRRGGRAGRHAGLPPRGQPGGEDPGRRPQGQGPLDRLAQERVAERRRDLGQHRRLRCRAAPRSRRRADRPAGLDVQVLEGVLEVDGDVYAAGAIIPLDAEARGRAIGAATLLVTKPR